MKKILQAAALLSFSLGMSHVKAVEKTDMGTNVSRSSIIFDDHYHRAELFHTEGNMPQTTGRQPATNLVAEARWEAEEPCWTYLRYFTGGLFCTSGLLLSIDPNNPLYTAICGINAMIFILSFAQQR